MVTLADIMKVIQDYEPIEVLVLNANITYNPRDEKMDKEWQEYEVLSMYSNYDKEAKVSYISITVREV